MGASAERESGTVASTGWKAGTGVSFLDARSLRPKPESSAISSGEPGDSELLWSPLSTKNDNSATAEKCRMRLIAQAGVRRRDFLLVGRDFDFFSDTSSEALLDSSLEDRGHLPKENTDKPIASHH